MDSREMEKVIAEGVIAGATAIEKAIDNKVPEDEKGGAFLMIAMTIVATRIVFAANGPPDRRDLNTTIALLREIVDAVGKTKSAAKLRGH